MKNFKLFMSTIMALSLVICLIFSILIPLNNLTYNYNFINLVQSTSLFSFFSCMIITKILFKENRKKTFNFFKNFIKKKEKIVLEKKVPEPDCGCKKKNRNTKRFIGGFKSPPHCKNPLTTNQRIFYFLYNKLLIYCRINKNWEEVNREEKKVIGLLI